MPENLKFLENGRKDSVVRNAEFPLPNKHEPQDSRRPQVIGEVVELSLLDKVHEPFERKDSGDKGDRHPDEEFRGERAALCALLEHLGIFYRVERLALEPFDEIEERCGAALTLMKLLFTFAEIFSCLRRFFFKAACFCLHFQKFRR